MIDRDRVRCSGDCTRAECHRIASAEEAANQGAETPPLRFFDFSDVCERYLPPGGIARR
ncbi:hypothetical protein [Roseivivax sp. CAU 1761]